MTGVRVPPTATVVAARDSASQIRLALACFGLVLLVLDPQVHPVPGAAAAGLAVLLATGLLHRRRVPTAWLRIEEPFALTGGVLIVTLGPPGIGPLTVLWLVSAATGVVGRGGRASATGRVLVLAVLASPMVRHGVGADTATVFAAGCGLLLTVGLVSNETHELLRDPLTGILSRAALLAETERAVGRARADLPLALILLDLDDFGALNKREGHEAGDRALRTAVEAVTGTLRHADTFGRLGGDEFVVLAVGEGRVVAQRALDAISAAGLRASAGVASAPGDAITAPELRRRADAALRASKRGGKARATVFEADLAPDIGPASAAPV